MSLHESKNLQHFYINEEQSFYLLSHKDAHKLKSWLELCESQLERLGYSNIELIGKGAYGFVFAGTGSLSGDPDNSGNKGSQQYVFKFCRITLPDHIKERLEEEGFMLSQVEHKGIPEFIAFQSVRGQSILMMSRAPGVNLQEYARQAGRVEPRLLLKIAAQMSDILLRLRNNTGRSTIVHGDIKPSNIMFDSQTETVSLIDWGAAVVAQEDHLGDRIDSMGIDAINMDFQKSNAKLGDIYFIGEEQLQGACSSPRFDEQGLAGTLYALASGQGSRFGKNVITPESLGLPIEFARTLAGMLDDDPDARCRAGDYFFENMRYMKHIVSRPDETETKQQSPIPLQIQSSEQEVETVVYSSRKGFLRQEIGSDVFESHPQYARHPLAGNIGTYGEYRNYLSGMGDTEKAFVIAVSHLGNYPVVGGLAVNWDDGGVYIDSSLTLYDAKFSTALVNAINNMVALGRAISKKGVFKSCMFDARKTLHIGRENLQDRFVADSGMRIPFDISKSFSPDAIENLSPDDAARDVADNQTRLHSYFEDGNDPDEMLELPESIMKILATMNQIHHTGCIIFEAVEKDLKIHNYLTLLDSSREQEFRNCLAEIIDKLDQIDGLGVSGFMKLPYKNTKFFSYLEKQPDLFSN